MEKNGCDPQSQNHVSADEEEEEMFTLVIFMLLNGYPATTTVPGFSSLSQCVKEAKKLADLSDGKGLAHFTVNMACLEVK